MSAFKAWASIALFGNIGMIIGLGYKVPKQPFCQHHCYVDKLSHFQDNVGSFTLAGTLFFLGVMGFMWFSARS